MKRYALDLDKFGLYPAAETLLGKFVEKASGGVYKPEHRKVFHDRRITKAAQERIKGYAEALTDTDHGAP